MQTKLLVALFSLLLVACASQPTNISSDVPGFLLGLWHGYIAIFSLIVGLFNDVRIYNFPNSGYLYDVGFVIGFLFCLFTLLCIEIAVVD